MKSGFIATCVEGITEFKSKMYKSQRNKEKNTLYGRVLSFLLSRSDCVYIKKTTFLLMGTAIDCRECLEYEADRAPAMLG